MIFDILKINFLPFNVALTSSKLFIVLRFEANFQSNLRDTLIAKIKRGKNEMSKIRTTFNSNHFVENGKFSFRNFHSFRDALIVKTKAKLRIIESLEFPKTQRGEDTRKQSQIKRKRL